MPQFPHEEVAFESGINVRFTIYNSNNDYYRNTGIEAWKLSISMRVPWNSLRGSGFCCCMPEIIM